MFHKACSRMFLIWLTLAVGLMLAGCASGSGDPGLGSEDAGQSEGIFVDGLGREVEISGPAQRVVSLSASNTEILFAIDAGAQVVGRDEFSDYPPQALDLPNVGGGWGELNLEAIVALEPDLVLASKIHTVEQVQSLEALGLTVFLVPNPASFDDLYGIIEQVGVLVGRQPEAQALAAELANRVQLVAERVRGAELVKVYYEIDATDPSAPYTAGSGTFGDMLISEAGGENVAGSLEGWVQLGLEELVAQDPQVMFFATGPFIPTTVESVAERPGWGAISAVAHGAVYPIDSDLIDLPGPRLVDGLELLAKAIHPEVFE